MTREVGGLLWWLSDDLVILGGLPLILVSANFVGQVFGFFLPTFTDPKMGEKSGICEHFIKVWNVRNLTVFTDTTFLLSSSGQTF